MQKSQIGAPKSPSGDLGVNKSINIWLENFAYKPELSWWIFALAGLLALGIALLTVSFQSYKAAVKNPVESLRYE